MLIENCSVRAQKWIVVAVWLAHMENLEQKKSCFNKIYWKLDFLFLCVFFSRILIEPHYLPLVLLKNQLPNKPYLIFFKYEPSLASHNTKIRKWQSVGILVWIIFKILRTVHIASIYRHLEWHMYLYVIK